MADELEDDGGQDLSWMWAMSWYDWADQLRVAQETEALIASLVPTGIAASYEKPSG